MSSLYDAFIAPSNFIQAFQRIAEKGSRGGIDRISVDSFGAHLDCNLEELRNRVRERRYIPEPVLEVAVPKFNAAGEWRNLGLPTVADKIVQAALLQIVEPLAERLFLGTSYGYRHGKGPFKAIRRVEHNLVNRKLCWVASQDVDNFFDALDHERLLTDFSRLVEGETRLVDLVALWCRSGIVARNGNWKNVEAGVRQGQIISPLLANLYLHPLDRFAAERGWGWVRYADNYLIQCRSEVEARQADQEAAIFLRDELRLALNRNGEPVCHLDGGFIFLGVEFKGQERSIALEKIDKMKRRVVWLLGAGNRAPLADVLRTLSYKIEGWRRYYGFLAPDKQFAAIDALIASTLAGCVKERVARGIWPAEVPKDLDLPRLSDQDKETDDHKILLRIWREALAPSAATIKKEADRKLAPKRQRHLRNAAVNGELLVITPGVWIGRRGERFVIRQGKKVMQEVLAHGVRNLMIGAHGLGFSSDVVSFCQERGIPVHFIDGLGKIIASLNGPEDVQNAIALVQIHERDTAKGMELARMFVLGKMKNQLAFLKTLAKHTGRKNGYGAAFNVAHPVMAGFISQVKDLPLDRKGASSFRQSLMGFEGLAAARYWDALSHLLPLELEFPGRRHQEASDLVNNLLNYGYAILQAQVANAVKMAGLHPGGSFLHALQEGRPSLVFDLMEEFRPSVVDRAALTMINRREPLALNSQKRLNDETRKRMAKAVLERLGTEIVVHGERKTVRDAVGCQAEAVVACLRGGKRYRPSLARW